MHTTDAQATELIPKIRIPGPRRDPWAEAADSAGHDVGNHRAYRWRSLAWLVPALLMGIVAAIGLGRPGLWTDEFATWGMTTVSWSEGLKVLRWVDAVIGPYYGLMKAWTEVFGDSDLSLRIPSVIAMALAAALTGAIGNRVYGLRVGLLAGVVFAVLPASSRFAQEARPYAFAVLGATIATYALVRILQGDRWWWFFAYAGGVALLGIAHLVALLLLAGHGWIILARRRDRTLAWVAAALVGILPALPLLWYGYDQKSQVAWIGSAVVTPEMFLETGFGTVAAAAAVGALILFALPLRYPSSIFLAWAALPLAALLVLDPYMPLLLPRYLAFTLPAIALLAATALSRPHLALALVATGVLAALAFPAQVAMRDSAGHDDEATRQVAALISNGYQPGDAIVYAERDALIGGGWLARDTVAHYVPVDRRPFDVYMITPPRTDGILLAAECTGATCVGDPPPRLWVVRLGYLPDAVQGLGEEKETLVRTRYREQQTWWPDGFTVALWVRTTQT
jgi:mannosyltransferase